MTRHDGRPWPVTGHDPDTGRIRAARALLTTSAAVGALLLAMLPALTSTALAADGSVTIAGLAFSPATVTVTEGDTVTWTNDDGVTHTATAGDGTFDTGNIAAGSSASVTFDTAGSYAYACTIHPSMTGTIVVEAAAASPSPSPSPTASSGPSTAPSTAPSAAPSAAPSGGSTAPPTDIDAVANPAGSGDGGLSAGLATLVALLAAALGAAALLSLRLRVSETEDDDRS